MLSHEVHWQFKCVCPLCCMAPGLLPSGSDEFRTYWVLQAAQEVLLADTAISKPPMEE